MIDWATARALPWQQRNALVVKAVRDLLPALDGTLTSMELAQRLHAGDLADQAALAQLLSRLAPHVGTRFATHTGEKIRRYGKTWQRWEWHGKEAT